jgi:hypothetical protein
MPIETRTEYAMNMDYEAPRMTIIGTVAELTQAQSIGASLDADYPSQTPAHELTFS